MALSRTSKTRVSGMHGGAGVVGKWWGIKLRGGLGPGLIPGSITADSTQRFCPQTFPGLTAYCLHFACVSLALPQSPVATGFQFQLLVCHLLAGG